MATGTVLLLVLPAEAVAQSPSNTSSHAKGLYSELCGGHCAVTVYGGKAVKTSMRNVFGIDDEWISPSDWSFDDSTLLAGALSRRIAQFANWSIEAEVGLGQRFGDMDATEVWGAFYFRWTTFPWNNVLKTSIAISTGINYASKVDALEERRGNVEGGSRLLHFLSPEITFSLPDSPDWELVARLHHRSGGGEYWADSWLFDGVTGGAQYITAGIRHRF